MVHKIQKMDKSFNLELDLHDQPRILSTEIIPYTHSNIKDYLTIPVKRKKLQIRKISIRLKICLLSKLNQKLISKPNPI